MNISWKNKIQIWQGLENFREVLKTLFINGIRDIDQKTLDKMFSSYNFQIDIKTKKEILRSIEDNIEHSSDTVTKQELKEEKDVLEHVKEDLILLKSTDEFNYQYVLREANLAHNLQGFVKIYHKEDSGHVALLSWEDSIEPVLYLTEKEGDQFRLHINYGKAGFAIVEESPNTYIWTHADANDYLDLVNAEHGSAEMSKKTEELALIEGNMAAVEALNKASLVAPNGNNLLQNNISLLELYKADLEKL